MSLIKVKCGDYIGAYGIKNNMVYVYYNGKESKPAQVGGMIGHENVLAEMLLRELVVAENQKQNA